MKQTQRISCHKRCFQAHDKSWSIRSGWRLLNTKSQLKIHKLFIVTCIVIVQIKSFFVFWFDFMHFILMSHNICPHVCLVLEPRAHVVLLCILPTIFFQTVDPRMQCWRSFGCGLSGVENATASRSLNAFSWGTWTNASFGKRKSWVGLVLYTYIDWDAPPRSNTRQ